MLQSKQIGKVLSQALSPFSDDHNVPPATTLASSPLSLLLLSSDGIPLTTVHNAILLTELELSLDALKIYSLIGYNQLKTVQDDWTIVELEKRLKVAIQRLGTLLDKDEEGSPRFYVALFYEVLFPDAVAKLKLDNVALVLTAGLKGYEQ